MMKKLQLRAVIASISIFSVFVITGCNSEDSDSKPASANSAESSGNKFYDAAVAKMAAAHPDLSASQHKAIVDHMTEGGEIGLGEVNSMKMDDLSSNAQRLVDAYKAGLAKAKEAK